MRAEWSRLAAGRLSLRREPANNHCQRSSAHGGMIAETDTISVRLIILIYS